MLVTVVVRAGWPMQEQAVARPSGRRLLREETACLGLQVDSMAAAPNLAVGTKVIMVAFLVLRFVVYVVTVVTGPLSIHVRYVDNLEIPKSHLVTYTVDICVDVICTVVWLATCAVNVTELTFNVVVVMVSVAVRCGSLEHNEAASW